MPVKIDAKRIFLEVEPFQGLKFRRLKEHQSKFINLCVILKMCITHV